MNKERLLLIAAKIENDPTFGMESFVTKQLSTDVCGTPRCICGHGVYEFDRSTFQEITSQSVGYGRIEKWLPHGQRVFDLSYVDAHELFAPEGIDLEDITGHEAAAVIRHYVETGEVDWNLIRDRQNGN